MTSYTNIFGGNTVLPADVSYRKIELTDDEKLVWTNSFTDSTKVATHIMDVEVKALGKKVFLPDATKVSVGTAFLIVNVSGIEFSLCDSLGNEIMANFSQGLTYYYYLTDNKTEVGSWRGIQLGAGNVIPGIINIAANSIGAGLTIGGSPITAPGGALTFELGDLLKKLAAFAENDREAGIVCFDPTQNEFITQPLEAGDGIKIDNPRGIDGTPRISLDKSILPEEGITTINMTAATPAVVITGSPGAAPTADFGIGVHDSLKSLYQIAVRGPSSSGFVTRYSFQSPYYIRRTLEAGNGILIQNNDGAAGNPSFAIDPAIVPAKGSVIESIKVIGDVAVGVSGSPLKGANPTLILNSDIDVRALAAGTMINHMQIPVAAGGWSDGGFKNIFNVKSMKRTGPGTYDITFLSENIRNSDVNAFFTVMLGSTLLWSVDNHAFTETSTLFFCDYMGNGVDTSFAFMAWALKGF